MEYRPFFLAPNHFWQTYWYIMQETARKFFYPMRAERQIIMAPDGGTMGIDWSISPYD